MHQQQLLLDGWSFISQECVLVSKIFKGLSSWNLRAGCEVRWDHQWKGQVYQRRAASYVLWYSPPHEFICRQSYKIARDKTGIYPSMFTDRISFFFYKYRAAINIYFWCYVLFVNNWYMFRWANIEDFGVPRGWGRNMDGACYIFSSLSWCCCIN